MIYRTLGILLVTLTVVPAMAQIVVDQCDTMEFSVTSRPGIDDSHFVWAVYNSSADPTDVLDPAGALDPAVTFVDGQYAGRTVQVTGLGPGKYYVRILVWDEVTCTDNIEMYVMEVLENKPTVEITGDSVCIGEPPIIKIIFTGKAPYDIVYAFGDESNTVNLNGITEPEISIPITDPLPVGTTTFWVMEVTDQCTVNSYEADERPRTGIIIYPKPTNSRIYQTDK